MDKWGRWGVVTEVNVWNSQEHRDGLRSCANWWSAKLDSNTRLCVLCFSPGKRISILLFVFLAHCETETQILCSCENKTQKFLLVKVPRLQIFSNIMPKWGTGAGVSRVIKQLILWRCWDGFTTEVPCELKGRKNGRKNGQVKQDQVLVFSLTTCEERSQFSKAQRLQATTAQNQNAFFHFAETTTTTTSGRFPNFVTAGKQKPGSTWPSSDRNKMSMRKYKLNEQSKWTSERNLCDWMGRCG